MRSGILYRWKYGKHNQENEERVGCSGTGRRSSGHPSQSRTYFASGGGHFGVRRPLRYMSHRLDLDEDQVKSLAGILNRLKTERAQAMVNQQRSVATVADFVEAAEFDELGLKEALEQRVQSAENLRDEVLSALKETHAILSDEQRAKLAYMLRSGSISI